MEIFRKLFFKNLIFFVTLQKINEKVTMKQTKIVASISDRRCDVDFIRQLYNAGVNVVRMNTAHASEEGIKNIIRNVREVSRHIGILIDTKGPEVRTTGCTEPIAYKTGDVVKLFGRPEIDSTHDIVNLSYENFAADIQNDRYEGMCYKCYRALIDDKLGIIK